MRCPACGEDNHERNRFCGQCGMWLEVVRQDGSGSAQHDPGQPGLVAAPVCENEANASLPAVDAVQHQEETRRQAPGSQPPASVQPPGPASPGSGSQLASQEQAAGSAGIPNNPYCAPLMGAPESLGTDPAGDSAAEWPRLSGCPQGTDQRFSGGVSGPSFLGLGADDGEASSLDDEPAPHKYWLRHVAAGAVCVLAALAAVRYRTPISQAGTLYWTQARETGLRYWPPIREAGLCYWPQARDAGGRYAVLAAGYLRQLREEGDRLLNGSCPPSLDSPAAQATHAPKPAPDAKADLPKVTTQSTPAEANSADAEDDQSPRSASSETSTISPQPTQSQPSLAVSAEDSGQQTPDSDTDNENAKTQTASPQQGARAISPEASEKLPQPRAQQEPAPAMKPPENAAPAPQALTAEPRDQRRDSARAAAQAPGTGLQRRNRVAAPVPHPPERLPNLGAGEVEYRLALTTSDAKLAQVLLWRAIAFGNTNAQVRLGEMYVYGQGIAPNCGQGLVLLRAAANRGNARASSKLGALYATGKCVRQDRVIAFRWFSAALAADPGSEWVSANRLIVWRQMSLEERALAARNH